MFYDDKMGFTQTVQFGIIMKYDKRSKKIQIYIRNPQTNSLGWALPFYTVLQIYWSKTFSADLCKLAQILSPNNTPNKISFSKFKEQFQRSNL